MTIRKLIELLEDFKSLDLQVMVYSPTGPKLLDDVFSVDLADTGDEVFAIIVARGDVKM